LEKSLASSSNLINKRRSERVMLQMRITVIAEDVEHKPRQEEALTLIVNAHGGLLKMKMDVHVGQPMRLVNPQNKIEQSCRVVRVDETGTEFFPWRSSLTNQIPSSGQLFSLPRIGLPRLLDAARDKVSSPE